MQALGYLRTGLRVAVLQTLRRARILQRMSVRLRASSWGMEDQVTDYQAILMPFAGTLIRNAGSTLRLPMSRDTCAELLRY